MDNCWRNTAIMSSRSALYSNVLLMPTANSSTCNHNCSTTARLKGQINVQIFFFTLCHANNREIETWNVSATSATEVVLMTSAARLTRWFPLLFEAHRAGRSDGLVSARPVESQIGCRTFTATTLFMRVTAIVTVDKSCNWKNCPFGLQKMEPS